jgi:D-tyrosyl-tRNA(Tyr) deacylase
LRALIQRVSRAVVSVDAETIAEIANGMLVLVGVHADDSERDAESVAEKIANLRIFADDEGKMNRSVLDIGGEALIVSQFTLYADTRRGRRPSFVEAAAAEIADPLVTHVAARLGELGVPTQTGEFGAHMEVELTNDGPVTILMESVSQDGA